MSMMTAFFFCFKDQSELGEDHERYYWKWTVEVSISAILHSIAESERYLSAGWHFSYLIFLSFTIITLCKIVYYAFNKKWTWKLPIN